METVFLGLGGNVGAVLNTLRAACQKISAIPSVINFNCSPFYLTTPVGPIKQDHYINGVCRFKTSMTPQELFSELVSIETVLGKLPKPKNEPRPIDIDILFFGETWIQNEAIIIPHPCWSERLFVLKPLMDLVSVLRVAVEPGQIIEFDLKKMLENFENKHGEHVTILNGQ